MAKICRPEVGRNPEATRLLKRSQYAINRVMDERAENNWSMCALSVDAADANTAARAALNVENALRHDYDLTTD